VRIRRKLPGVIAREGEYSLFLSFFDKRSPKEAFKDFWENADKMNMHPKYTR
jgi:hypothetical protein